MPTAPTLGPRATSIRGPAAQAVLGPVAAPLEVSLWVAALKATAGVSLFHVGVLRKSFSRDSEFPDHGGH